MNKVQKRFFSKVNKTKNCWLWTAGKCTGGYGSFWFEGKNIVAHKMCYQMLIGKVPEGMTLDHLCRKTDCVNPSHLEVVTQRINTLRGISPIAINARKTHCRNGHPLFGSNLYVHKNGLRRCRKCNHDTYMKRRYQNV